MGESKKKRFTEGALVYIESDEDSDEVYILEEGEVELAGKAGVRRFRPVLHAGDIFGFTSCLCRRPRMETARVRSNATVVVLDRASFLERVQSDLASRIMSYFAEELRAYDGMMVTPAAGSEVSDAETRLWDLGDLYFRKNRTGHALHVLGSYLENYPGGLHAGEAKEHREALRAKAGAPGAQAAQKGIFRAFSDGEMIFCENEPGEELYIIKTGKVQILKVTASEELLLSMLREGDIFGELAIVSNKPRNATAVASGEVTVIPVTRDSLPEVFERSPAIISRILVSISQRIWFTFIRVQSRLYENPVTRAYVMLENKLLEERISLSSTRPASIPLGIMELLGMVGVPSDQQEKLKAVLTDDKNLTFNFRQIVIESPNALSTKARFFRTRDHLEGPVIEQAAAPRRKRPAEQAPIGLDPHELRVPPEAIP